MLVILFTGFFFSAGAETPLQFAERFYRSSFRWRIRGVPTVEERKCISGFFSAQILQLYAAADRQRTEFERRYPFNPEHPEAALKPPWCKEGDPFTDNYEGISAFAVGRVVRVGRHVAVQAHLEYTEGGSTHRWTNLLVLDRAGSNWVVCDIHFAGGETLVAIVQKGLSEIEEWNKLGEERGQAFDFP